MLGWIRQLYFQRIAIDFLKKHFLGLFILALEWINSHFRSHLYLCKSRQQVKTHHVRSSWKLLRKIWEQHKTPTKLKQNNEKKQAPHWFRHNLYEDWWWFLFEQQKRSSSINVSSLIRFLLLHVSMYEFGFALVQLNSSTTTTKKAFIFKRRCSVQLESELSLNVLYSFIHYAAVQGLTISLGGLD